MKNIVISEVNSIAWYCALYSGFVAFLLANILWNYAVKHLGSTKVSVYGNLPPVMVIILSAIIFHDVLSFTQLVSGVIILIGVILVQMRKKDQTKTIKVQKAMVQDKV
ncbi:MAG: DMT family transporter [Sphaerochaetaceae bacterium]|nr:DMT family transporter [Sphaerochaetaceae bacterium]